MFVHLNRYANICISKLELNKKGYQKLNYTEVEMYRTYIKICKYYSYYKCRI